MNPVPHLRLFGRTLLSMGCLFFILQFQSAFAADEWFARVWQTDEGLPDNVITGLAQTRDGYLWVATDGGLLRFDGAEFQDFTPATDAMSTKSVPTLQLDRSDRLWLGLPDGEVICADRGQARVFSAKDGLPKVRARMLTEDGEGNMWLTYAGAAGVIRLKDGKVTNYEPGDALPVTGACRLACDINGQLWFDKGNDLGVFRNGKFQTLLKIDEAATCIAAARGGGVWIVTPTRLLKFAEGGKLEDKGTLPHEGTASGGVALEDKSGAVWLGTAEANGLLRYDGNKFTRVRTSNPQILCLLEDREDNLWVGTGGGGLTRLQLPVLELLNPGNNRISESVRSACEDAAGTLWMVTADGSLVRRDGEEQTVVPAAKNWPGGRAVCVTSARDGAVWIGTRNHGIYRLQNNQFKAWRTEDGLTTQALRSLLVSSNGDVWLGADSALEPVVQRLRGGKFKTFQVPDDARVIRAMAEDSDGDIWLGTSGGYLLRIAGDTVVNAMTNGMQPVMPIRCLSPASDGGVWIGYAGYGLGRWKDGKYTRLTSQDGLEDSYVSQIAEDDQQGLWVSGGHGIYRIQHTQLADVIAGRSSHVRLLTVGRGKGLPGLQANYDNHPGAFLGHDGRIRIATRSGLAVVHTENVRDNPAPPPVLVERVAVDGETAGLYDSRSSLHPSETRPVADLTHSEKIRLRPNHRKLEIEFTAVNLTAPENIQFRHRLEGFDDDWVEDGANRQVSYPRMGAGEYRFRLAACNNSGVWNETSAGLSFVVAPFMWQTWWFRLSVLATFTLSVIAIVRYVSFRRLHLKLRTLEQQATLDKERARIARDLHDDLGGSLTQVALMLDMKQREKASTPDAGEDHLRECAAKVRQVVNSVDEIIWAISPRNDNVRYLVDYLSQFAVEFLHAANIRCRVNLPEQFPDRAVSPEARHNLFLVVKEALNNVARHAHASEVQLHVTTTDERIEITINDNGQGFAHSPDNARSDGLRNMRQRMEEIGGQLILESKPGSGTQIQFLYHWPPPH